MKSLASLSLLFLVAAQEPPPGTGPRGSSQRVAGEMRYDAVGFAGRGASAGVSASSAGLPAGSYAEVTALDSGRTIVVAILGSDVAPGHVAMLSNAAATALGMAGDSFAIRIRKVVPTPQDIVQLRDGGAASFRAEAPPALLTALRKQLPAKPKSAYPVAKPTAPANKPVTTKPIALRPTPTPLVVQKPAPRPTPSPVPATTASGRYVVQVAALSNAARAEAVSKAVGGTVISGPPVWRVRLGPFPDAATASRAKADAARKGYPGGPVTRIP